MPNNSHTQAENTFWLTGTVSYKLEGAADVPDAQSAALPDRHDKLVLARFTYLRRNGAKLVMASPLCDFAVSCESSEAMSLLCRLSFGASAMDLAQMVKEESLERILRFLGFLMSFQFIHSAQYEEAADLITWEFHDLLFHRFSRVTDPHREFATFRFRGRLKSPPAFKEIMSDDCQLLEKPDLVRLAKEDPSLTAVLESRRSLRGIGDRPLSLEQLGEFLYRTAHIHEVFEQDGIERMRRPYPSGGGLHELEFYVVANKCTGLQRGLYHYRPEQHALYKLQASDQAVESLLSRSALASAMEQPPQILIVLTSKFGRMAYKYEAIAYRVTLLNVGAAMQTMYLVATAMGLNPCALGSGFLRSLPQEANLGWLKEGAIGEFMLNSPP